MADGLETQAQRALENLYLLARLTPGQKLNVHRSSVSVVPRPTWWNVAGRWWHNESRDSTFAFISRSVDDAIFVATSALASPSAQTRAYGLRLTTLLQECGAGLSALAQTYQSDAMFVARLNVVGDKINLQLKQIGARRADPAE